MTRHTFRIVRLSTSSGTTNTDVELRLQLELLEDDGWEVFQVLPRTLGADWGEYMVILRRVAG